MRGRKLLALALSAALTLGLAGPALAEVGSDQALMDVTAKVKETLGLDTAAYTDFQGWADENVLLGKRWSLEWTGDGTRLSITADDAGKVYSYYRSDPAGDVDIPYVARGKMSIPQLPEDKSDAAFAAAKDFLGKALQPGLETVELENGYTPSLRQDSYHYSGTVLLNGLESPISCSVNVRASDLAVTSFWRSDEHAGYLGGIPSAATNRNEGQARSLLRSTVKMEPMYVLEEDGVNATLRYVPVAGDDYYVDAVSGELVNLSELRRQLREGGAAAGGAGLKNEMFSAADASVEESKLTQAEKDGAAILTGAMSKEDLDAALKGAWPEIGLGAYTLSTANYSISEKELPKGMERTAQDYTVTCRLVYSKQENNVMRYKYVTVEAKTGQLMTLSSRRIYRGEGKENINYSATVATAQGKVKSILSAFARDRAEVMGLYKTLDARAEYTWEHIFYYQQTAGGYFYPGNYYTIGVDATDGTISRIEGNFNGDIVLRVPEGKVITADEAADAYVNAMAVPHVYLEVPVSIDLAGSDIMPLLKEAGYSYVNALKTGFVLTQPEESYVEGVDAQTGKAVIRAAQSGDEDEGMRYDDLEGHWVKEAAEALAVFGVGLGGGSLKPDETLTQLDMVALLCSVEGYPYDPATAEKEDTDALYSRAYSLGIVTPETRQEDKVIARGELVRLLVNAAGYERIATLPGIFRCDFSDRSQIHDSDLGYAALAQGLGLIKGGSDGAYAAERESTRAEAVAMLYQYMK